MSLYKAALENNFELIEKLLKTEYVNIGLYGACESGNFLLVRVFIEKYGAWDINNALYYATIKSHIINEDLIKYLIKFDGILILMDQRINIRKYKIVENFLITNKFIESN